MRTNNMLVLRRILIFFACGVAAPSAWSDCVSVTTDGCEPAYVYDSYALSDSMQPWLNFSVDPTAGTVSYPRGTDEWRFVLAENLAFRLPADSPRELVAAKRASISLDAGEEPAFAVLFGSAARLLSDGTMALGRGELRSNSPQNKSNQWGDLLPAAYSAWNDRLDVDLGLSYAGDRRFSTSLGFAEKIGSQNNDPAVVGWFEYRF